MESRAGWYSEHVTLERSLVEGLVVLTLADPPTPHPYSQLWSGQVWSSEASMQGPSRGLLETGYTMSVPTAEMESLFLSL